jgi:cardiolipin synthase
MQDIQGAQHSIHLLYFIWTEDEFTLQVKDALIERAKGGVKVRALVDQSSFVVSKKYQEDLLAAGVELYPYLAFKNLKTLHTANYRCHRKIVVIDGKVGYVGGMNLDKEQLPGFHPLGDWRDTHLRLTGEAALALQASFAISWLNTTGEKIVDPVYYPPVSPGSQPFTPVQLTQSGPDSQWKAMQQLYFFMIMSAREKCYIQSPFFIPDESLLEAIKAAALSGVDVRIICTPRGGTYQLPYRAAYTYFADVARAGARIFLYQKGYFHAKTINIDSAVCAVGTANFDIRSFSLNYETMAVIYDDTVAHELEEDFMNDIQNCEEWSLEEYQRSPVWRRLVDSIFRLASPIL